MRPGFSLAAIKKRRRMPYRTRFNLNGLDRRSSVDLMAEFDAIKADLDEIRNKYNLLQQALNTGTAVGAAGYPNGTMQLALKGVFQPT
jgi:hypothetical protein